MSWQHILWNDYHRKFSWHPSHRNTKRKKGFFFSFWWALLGSTLLDLILTRLHLQRPALQIRSRSQVPEVRTWACLLGGTQFNPLSPSTFDIITDTVRGQGGSKVCPQQWAEQREHLLTGYCPQRARIAQFCGGVELSTRMNQIKINVLLSSRLLRKLLPVQYFVKWVLYSFLF